jgi:hypothetical protein
VSERHRDPLHEVSPDDELLLSRVRAVLSPMPAVDRRHVAQVLAAVHNRRRTPWQRLTAPWDTRRGPWHLATSPIVRGATLAAAALVVGFVSRGFVMQPTTTAPPRAAAAPTAAAPTAAAPTAAPMQPVDAAADAATRPVPVQFLLGARDVPDATQVSLVGDFNDWNAGATPLALHNGVWSSSVPLAPGRHVYAFVVNGTTWLADPQAPRAADTDFGRPGSVIIVQAP